MTYILRVIEPFGSYKVGDEITDAQAIADALTSNPSHVVKVAKTEDPTK